MSVITVYVHRSLGGQLGGAEPANQDCLWAGEDGKCGTYIPDEKTEPIKSKPISTTTGKPLIIQTISGKSEDSEDTIFGFSYKQILIAGGVGVGLYLLAKSSGTGAPATK